MAPLTALLLLLLPAGAGAATPSGLVGQPVANVNGVVQGAGAKVGHVTAQVDDVVAAPVDGTQRELRGGVPANPIHSGTVDRTVDTAETLVGGAATDQDGSAPAGPPTIAQTPAEARRHASAPAPSRSARRVLPDSGSSAGVARTASGNVATGSAPKPAHELLTTSDTPAGPSPADPAFGASSGAGVASSAFSAGAFAVLLMALCLAASSIKTRLPRFDEAGRPLPLVFALERPG